MLIWCQMQKEKFIIDCQKVNPSGEYGLTEISIDALNRLNKKCKDMKVLPTSLSEKSTDAEIDAAENKCRLACYPDEKGYGNNQPVCWQECSKNRQDPKCKQCLERWSCAVTSGNEVALPCDYQGVQIKITPKTEQENREAIQTYAQKCMYYCKFGADLLNKDCNACIKAAQQAQMM